MNFICQFVGNYRRLSQRLLITLLMLIAAPQFAFAGYQLDKVRVYLSQQSSIDTLKVTNPDKTPANIQAQVYAWTYKDGKEDLTPTSEIIVSPPIMRVPPNRTQLLRVGWRKPTPLTTEKMFRLFVSEITPEKPLTQTGVRIRLRLGIPIFIAPNNPVLQATWTSQGLSGKTFKVLVANTGNMHINLATANLDTDDGKTVGTYSGPKYIFPGQSATIDFTMTDTAAKNLNIVASTDTRELRSKITLP